MPKGIYPIIRDNHPWRRDRGWRSGCPLPRTSFFYGWRHGRTDMPRFLIYPTTHLAAVVGLWMQDGATGRVYTTCFHEWQNGFEPSWSRRGFDCIDIRRTASVGNEPDERRIQQRAEVVTRAAVENHFPHGIRIGFCRPWRAGICRQRRIERVGIADWRGHITPCPLIQGWKCYQKRHSCRHHRKDKCG